MKRFKNYIMRFPAYYFLILIVAINILFLFLAGVFYKGVFSFWNYPYSYLGTKFTLQGTLNSPSFYIYGAAMLLSGVISILLATQSYYQRHKADNILRPLLFFAAGFGFILASFSPDDVAHRFHVVGSSFFVASFWILATSALYEIKERLGFPRYLMAQLILQAPIMVYAFAFFRDLDPFSYFMQKFAFLSLAAVIIYSFRQMETPAKAEAVLSDAKDNLKAKTLTD